MISRIFKSNVQGIFDRFILVSSPEKCPKISLECFLPETLDSLCYLSNKELTLKIIIPMSRRIHTGLAWYWKTTIGFVVGNYSFNLSKISNF